jgi:hypothetical protein
MRYPDFAESSFNELGLIRVELASLEDEPDLA